MGKILYIQKVTNFPVKSLVCPICNKKPNWHHNLAKLDKTEHYVCSLCKTKLYKKDGKKIGLIYFFENE